MLGNGKYGFLGDVDIAGHVQRGEGVVILEEGDETRVGQVLAAGQSHALDPGTDGQGHDGAVIDLLGQGGEVETLDKFRIGERGGLEAQGITY